LKGTQKDHVLIYQKNTIFIYQLQSWKFLKRITSKALKTHTPEFTEALTRCVHQANVQISQHIHPLHTIHMQWP